MAEPLAQSPADAVDTVLDRLRSVPGGALHRPPGSQLGRHHRSRRSAEWGPRHARAPRLPGLSQAHADDPRHGPSDGARKSRSARDPSRRENLGSGNAHHRQRQLRRLLHRHRPRTRRRDDALGPERARRRRNVRDEPRPWHHPRPEIRGKSRRGHGKSRRIHHDRRPWRDCRRARSRFRHHQDRCTGHRRRILSSPHRRRS